MSLVCALSGQVPEVPVVSKYGHVFERDLIFKALVDNGICPITNENLAVEELTPIKVSPVVKPRPVTATSVPGMLTLFQNEWDALMLETYNLKKALDQTRQELSQALYQHDAACRVIARIVKERDSARE
jgi:pre-mRNA-processing factor 19